METHLAFVFIMWPKSQTEERWAAASLPRCGLRTREGASAGQHTCPPPVPGSVGSAHTSTSHPRGRGVRTHDHLPSLWVSGQHTHPPPIPGGSGSGHTSTSHPWGQRVRTHIHVPSLGAAGQDTCPPPVPGGSGSAHVHLPSLGAVGQDTHPPPVPGGNRSGHTSTSRPWERGRTQQRAAQSSPGRHGRSP